MVKDYVKLVKEKRLGFVIYPDGRMDAEYQVAEGDKALWKECNQLYGEEIRVSLAMVNGEIGIWVEVDYDCDTAEEYLDGDVILMTRLAMRNADKMSETPFCSKIDIYLGTEGNPNVETNVAIHIPTQHNAREIRAALREFQMLSFDFSISRDEVNSGLAAKSTEAVYRVYDMDIPDDSAAGLEMYYFLGTLETCQILVPGHQILVQGYPCVVAAVDNAGKALGVKRLGVKPLWHTMRAIDTDDEQWVECPYCRSQISLEGKTGQLVACPNCHSELTLKEQVCLLAEVVVPPYEIPSCTQSFTPAHKRPRVWD